MPSVSARKSVRRLFPFLVPVARSWRAASDAIGSRNLLQAVRIAAAEEDAFPFSSVKLHGSRDASPLAATLSRAFGRALAGDVELPAAVRSLEGMSGQGFRSLLNQVVGAVDGARYLEVGSWKGSTVAAATAGNGCRATCIDDWSFYGGRDELIANLAALGISERVDVIERDFRTIDFAALGRFNVYFFDGPHTEQDQYDGVVIAQPALADEHIVIVDDWNWPGPRRGTLRALAKLGLTIDFAIEIRTSEMGRHPERRGAGSEWHNGYFIAAVRKA